MSLADRLATRVRLRLHLGRLPQTLTPPPCTMCVSAAQGLWLGVYHDAQLCDARRALAAGQPQRFN